MLRTATSLRIALIAALSLVLCHTGRAQTPSASITIYPNGTITTAYFGVNITTSNFSSVSSVIIVVTDDTGKQYSQAVMSGSNPSFSTNFQTPQLIPSGGTSYNAPITVRAVVTGTGGTGEPPPAASAQSNVVTATVQIGYRLGSSNTATVTAPTSAVHLGNQNPGQPFLIASAHQFDFYRYDQFGSYSPPVVVEIDSTFPGQAGYNILQDPGYNDDLPLQTGDCIRQFTLNYTEQGYSTSGFSNPSSFNFLDRALSYYPAGTLIANQTSTATADYP